LESISDGDRLSLRRRFAQSSSWLVLGTSADNIIQFIIFAILARLLPVRDLGIVAFTMLFVDISRIFVSGGLSATVVQRATWDDRVSSVCFTYNATMSIVVALLFALVGAPLIDHFYGHGSGLVAVALAAVFFIDAIKAIHVAKLRREMKYRSLAVRGTFAGLVSGSLAIGMALAGAGVWSLVFQRLANQTVLTWLTLRASRWRPKLSLDRRVLREVMPFGFRVTVTRGLEMFNLRIPDLLVGVIAGPVAVAIYRVGTRALDTMRRIVLFPFQDASFSALSRLRAPGSIAGAYLRLNRAVATATFPIFFGLTAVAAEVTVLLFGEKYAASGEIFAVLSLAGIPNTLILFAASAFMAAGQPRIGTITNGILAVLNLSLIVPLALRFGGIGAAFGNLLAMTMILPVVVTLLKSRLGLRVRDLAAAVGTPALLSAGMAAVLWTIKLWVLPPMHNMAEVATLVVAGVLLYMAMFALWGRDHLRELVMDLQPLFPERVSSRLAKLGARI
jgi:PST family polysaccharide transporter